MYVCIQHLCLTTFEKLVSTKFFESGVKNIKKQMLSFKCKHNSQLTFSSICGPQWRFFDTSHENNCMWFFISWTKHDENIIPYAITAMNHRKRESRNKQLFLTKATMTWNKMITCVQLCNNAAWQNHSNKKQIIVLKYIKNEIICHFCPKWVYCIF